MNLLPDRQLGDMEIRTVRDLLDAASRRLNGMTNNLDDLNEFETQRLELDDMIKKIGETVDEAYRADSIEDAS